MKRLILLAIIIAVAVGIFFYKKSGVAVAGSSNNQNFVTHEKFESTLQSNLDLIWSELEAQKNSIAEINSKLESIEAKLGQ